MFLSAKPMLAIVIRQYHPKFEANDTCPGLCRHFAKMTVSTVKKGGNRGSGERRLTATGAHSSQTVKVTSATDCHLASTTLFFWRSSTFFRSNVNTFLLRKGR